MFFFKKIHQLTVFLSQNMLNIAKICNIHATVSSYTIPMHRGSMWKTASLVSFQYLWFLWQSKWEDSTSNTSTSIWASVVVWRWLGHSCTVESLADKIAINCTPRANPCGTPQPQTLIVATLRMLQPCHSMECQGTLFSISRRRCNVQHVVQKTWPCKKMCPNCILVSLRPPKIIEKSELSNKILSKATKICWKQQKPGVFE